MTLPLGTDYTSRDFDALKTRAWSLIHSVFPTWTDEQVDNFGNILVELPCWLLDVLNYYQDQQAREGRFGTLVLRKSMIALCKLIGYQMPGAAAATADVVVTITNPQALTGTVTAVGGVPVIAKTDSVTSPIRGELISPSPFAIPVSSVSRTFVWEHSLTQPRVSVSSTGLADQKVLMPNAPFLDDNSEVVQTLSQGIFTRVESFFSSGPTSLHYRIEIDQNDRASVVFGDGLNGVIPVGTINVDYRIGGGKTGNVEATALRRLEGAFIDSVGTRAYLTVSNASAASGGVPREEVDGARVNAPASIRVTDRTVAREDFEINAKRVAGVGRALMLTSNEQAGIEENTGDLYIVPSTGGVPSQALLDAVYTMCTVTYPCTVTFQLRVKPASYLKVDIRAVVFLRQGYTATTVKNSIVTNLTSYFAPLLTSGAPNTLVDFGFNYKDADGLPAGEIAWSDIEDVVRDTSGVRKVDPGDTGLTLNGLRSDLSIPNWQFPQLGDVTVINGDTGDEI